MNDKDVVEGTAPAASSGDESSTTVRADATSSPVQKRANARTEILHEVIAETRSAPLPKCWRFLATEAVRQLCGEPSELVAKLQQEFTEVELVDARVLVRGQDNELRLAATFGDASSRFRILHDIKGKPCDAVSARGALSSADPPCFRFGCARQAKNLEPTRAFVVFDDLGLHVLSALGYPCTTAAGLTRLTGRQVHRVFADLKTSAPAYRLTIVGCRLADFAKEASAVVDPVLIKLWRTEELFDYDTGKLFDFWDPEPEELRQIRSAVGFRERGVIHRALFASLDHSVSPPVDALNSIMARTDRDLLSAHDELGRALARSRRVPRPLEMKTARERLMRSLDRAVGDKFLQAAETTPDPIKASLLLIGGELMGGWQKSYYPLVAAQMVENADFRTCDGLNNKWLSTRLSLINGLAKISRELSRAQ